MTILRSASEIASASMADLIETYNHFAEKPVKKFENRTVAARRVEMTLMAATDRAGHAGVKPGEAPKPMTVAEAEAKKAANAPKPEAVATPAANVAENAAKTAEEATEAVAETNPYPAGSKRAELWERVRKSPKPVQRPPVVQREAGAPRSAKVTAVKLTGAGRTKLQASSVRAAVLSGIVTLAAETEDGRVTIEALAKHCGVEVRGHVQKLIVTGHVESA